MKVKALAPINIALIKYWGKRDDDLNLPLNNSLSITLNVDDLASETIVESSSTFPSDSLSINNKVEEIPPGGRVDKVLRLLRVGASPEGKKLLFRISSTNNFPTAAGVASSASGYCALVGSVSRILKVDDELSRIARQGSGSACRSIHGGFVEWRAGTTPDGSDSFAHQLYDEKHWPDLQILIIVTANSPKAVGSTVGMQRSARTSELLKYRVTEVVSRRIHLLREAIKNKDFPSLAEITMKESNQLHAICLDTYPPLNYLNTMAKKIIDLVHCYNEHYNSIQVAYTFDAGSNAFLLFPSLQAMTKFGPHLVNHFPNTSLPSKKYIMTRSQKFHSAMTKGPCCDVLPNSSHIGTTTDSIQYMIHTTIGKGMVCREV